MITAGFTTHKGFKRAFTMMEILTVMAIISVVAAITIPAVENFNAGIKVKAAAEIFVQSVRLAKYRAISEQGVHRLIFSSDRSYFKVQAYAGDNEGSGEPHSTAGLALPPDYDSLKWESIADAEEVEIPAGVEVIGNLPAILYFWINGTIVRDNTHTLTDNNRKPIGEIVVSFRYGSAAIRVLINGLGVFSSESYSADTDLNAENDGVLW